MARRLIKRHCHLCGRRLWASGWLYSPGGVQDEGVSIAVCRRCQETAPRCDVCGVPLGEDHVRLPDGRRTCARCHQTAVYDPIRAQALFERVTHIVAGQLKLELNVGADFTLVDGQHLRRMAQEASSELYTDPEKAVGLFVRKGRRRALYVVTGLPQIMLIQTIAHEWAHAWQGENCPLLKDPLLREGFAEWVSYKTLQALGATKKLALMAEQNGLYGEGLRHMLKVEQHNGFDRVLALCRHAS